MTTSLNFRALYGKLSLHHAMHKKWQSYNPKDGQELPAVPPSFRGPPRYGDGSWSPGKVCIIGAGAAGMATAIFIHDACVKAGVAPPTIDIYEAAKSSGGRVYSYQFKDSDHPAVHNYYDIGAMRIPEILPMQSTINMIDYLVNEKKQDIVKQPYIYSDSKSREPLMYYYRHYSSTDADNALKQFKTIIEPIVATLNNAKTSTEWEAAFWDLCKKYDSYSTRAYLLADGLTYEETETAETFDTSTGLFDQAFMETICDYADFKSADGKPWIRLEDSQKTVGMQALTNAMENYLKSLGIKINYGSPVRSLVHNADDISVGFDDSSKSYESVINTTTMGCLGRMDIAGLNLSDDVLTGIRALSYDRATKVAIKFSSDWWTPLLSKHGEPPFLGGVSGSDLPISNVVYPSWQDEGPTILMISYAWAQDATRLASLIPDYGDATPTTPEDPIAALCLRSLAKLWSKIPNAPSYSALKTLYQSHHAYAWANNPNTADAFALFGPGQFSHLYPLMAQPQCRGDAKNKVAFYFAGEATSAHHAWISGALDSAYMTVWQWAGIQDPSPPPNPVQQAMKDLPFGEGPGLHVAEMSEKLLTWALWAAEPHETP